MWKLLPDWNWSLKESWPFLVLPLKYVDFKFNDRFWTRIKGFYVLHYKKHKVFIKKNYDITLQDSPEDIQEDSIHGFKDFITQKIWGNMKWFERGYFYPYKDGMLWMLILILVVDWWHIDLPWHCGFHRVAWSLDWYIHLGHVNNCKFVTRR